VEIASGIMLAYRSAVTSKCGLVKVVLKGNGMITRLNAIVANRLWRWLVWLGFAILFYTSGEAFTMWLLAPTRIRAGLQWLWVALFPVLLPAFFVVNRWWGCGNGTCTVVGAAQSVNPFPGH
jgi:hypothetical protein